MKKGASHAQPSDPHGHRAALRAAAHDLNHHAYRDRVYVICCSCLSAASASINDPQCAHATSTFFHDRCCTHGKDLMRRVFLDSGVATYLQHQDWDGVRPYYKRPLVCAVRRLVGSEMHDMCSIMAASEAVRHVAITRCHVVTSPHGV